jgi:translation initiation factor 2 alpha subunit (eIF-2alpha)
MGIGGDGRFLPVGSGVGIVGCDWPHGSLLETVTDGRYAWPVCIFGCADTNVIGYADPTSSPSTMRPLQMYANPLPAIGEVVVATVQRIGDTAVYCTMPAYRDFEVMLPTSEINVRRGRRVIDYVRVGQVIAVSVIRDDGDKLDVSLKQVREAERDAALAKHTKDLKIALIVRTACGLDEERVAAMYRDLIWPRSAEENLYTLFEEIKAAGPDADMTVWALPAELVTAVHAKMPEATYTASADVTIRFAPFHDGAARVAAALTELAKREGVEVFVVAPPKYRLTATDKTQARADARLAAAVAAVPVAS